MFEVKDATMSSAVTLIVNCDFKQFKKVLAKYSGHKTDDEALEKFRNSQGMTLEVDLIRGGSSRVIWVEHFDWMIHDMGVLVHEITHAVSGIMESKNIPYRYENDEVVAYMTEFYTVEFFKKLSAVYAKKNKR